MGKREGRYRFLAHSKECGSVRRREILAGMLLAAIALLGSGPLGAPTTSLDALEASFVNPPNSARPHTWWHWMDGNVTKVGITKDLEAMAEVGIGGAQMFTVAQGIPKGPVDYMSPKWREMTTWAVREANRLG